MGKRRMRVNTGKLMKSDHMNFSIHDMKNKILILYSQNVILESFQSALNSSEEKPLCIWSSVLLFSFTITQQELGSIHSSNLIPANNSIKEMELSISQIIICSNCYFLQTGVLFLFFLKLHLKGTQMNKLHSSSKTIKANQQILDFGSYIKP